MQPAKNDKTVLGYRLVVRQDGGAAYYAAFGQDAGQLAGRRMIFASGDDAVGFLLAARAQYPEARLEPCRDRRPNCGSAFAAADAAKR